MKKIIIVLSILVFAISLIGCGGSDEPDNRINLPIASSELKDTNYLDVMAEFEDAGFTNVRAEAMDDLVLGWFSKDGEVEEVSVDGYTSFTTSKESPDVEIVILYHSFPEEEEVEEESTPESEVAVVPTETPEPTETPKPTETPGPTWTPKPTTEIDVTIEAMEIAATQIAEAEEGEVITVDNNEEFAELLNLGDPGDPKVKKFASKYAFRTIEFDGNIAHMMNHGDYTTRYDFLIAPWDYSETSISGPSFKFEDINVVWDLNLIGDNVPDTIGIGDNLHFVAKIINYDETSQLFYLDPVSTEVR